MTADQLTLDDAPARPEYAPVGDPIADAWWTFHRRWPAVGAELRRLARQAKDRGQDRLGIAMLWEVLRWRRMTDDHLARVLPPSLNNNHRALYARWLDADPDLAGMFQTRHRGPSDDEIQGRHVMDSLT